MEPTNYEKVVEAVKALNPAEQWRLRDLLDVWLEPPGPAMSEEEFNQEMVRKGLLEAPCKKMDIETFRAWKPVEVQGKPISETIIEERR